LTCGSMIGPPGLPMTVSSNNSDGADVTFR
jgi:hypothetical protein